MASWEVTGSRPDVPRVGSGRDPGLCALRTVRRRSIPGRRTQSTGVPVLVFLVPQRRARSTLLYGPGSRRAGLEPSLRGGWH